MVKTLSKSRFKPKALEFFRQVEETGLELVITDRGRPVARIVPYVRNPEELLRGFRGSVLRYEDPTEPERRQGQGSGADP